MVSLTYGLVGILMYDLIRKLWLISRIYTLGGKFDLSENRRTLYAFSGLTARILAGWLILSYPSALLATGNWRSPAWLTVTGLTLAAILIAFVQTLLDSLVVERDVLAKISIWPWQSDTLAGFASVVLAPIGLWLIQTLFKQLLGMG